MQSVFALLLLKGILVGSIYALISLGFNVIYRTTGVLNFAQGEFVMVGSLLTAWLFGTVEVTLLAAVPLGILGAALAGLLVDRLAIGPVRSAPPVVHIIVTVGASLVIRAGAALIWGTEPYHLPPLQEGGFKALGVGVDYQSLWMALVAAVSMIALAAFFGLTATGRAMRACAENAEAARLCGVQPARMSAFAFGLSGALAGLAGILLTPVISMSYDRGTMLGLKGFAAAILGGLGHPIGGVASGLCLGVLEHFSAWFSSAFKETLALGIVVLALVFRPRGLWVK
jgi:branched-chain amino acid transport system permease protein